MCEFSSASFTLPSLSNSLIIGCTGAGKTNLCLDICLNRNKVFDTPVDKVLYLIQNNQPAFDRIRKLDKEIFFVDSIENLEAELTENKANHTLVCYDDFLLSSLTNYSTYILDVIIRRSHHEKLSVLFNTQLLFPSTKFRGIVLNCHNFIF